MRVTLLFVLLCITLVLGTSRWEDCGIPLTRKIYYTGVVVSPSTISIANQLDNHDVSINVAAQIKDYTVQPGTNVSMMVTKDGETYFNGPVGDLCTILYNANRAYCPLPEGAYSYSYQYTLPPLPSGNYTVVITTYEPITGNQIGCLSTTTSVIGLGLDACSYTSTLTANMDGTVSYLNDNSLIQIGPRGPGNVDLGTSYPWGLFKSIVASPDLVGYSFQPQNYVWGIRGAINTSVTQNQFDGTLYIGWRPDTANYEGAQLVYQGVFSWIMTPNPSAGNPATAPAYFFQSGTVNLIPEYMYPDNFPYPLNIGNLGTLKISQSSTQTLFTVSVSRSWCRCNCANGGVGIDNLLQQNNKHHGLSSWKKGTIAASVIGSVALIVIIILIIKFRKSKPRPVVYDDADLLDPQKPDYGTIAINEAFEAEEQEYN